MSFQWPLVLVALVVIPLAVAAYMAHERRRPQFAARFTNPALLPNVVDRTPGWRRHALLAVLLTALAAMIVGVARPHASVSVRREDANVVLAIDVSRSMAAADVKPTRLGAARNAAAAFLRKVPKKYRVGLVSFATRAVAVVPPTVDREAVAAGLAALRTGEGTALGDAVALSVELGARSRAPSAILLISDGKQTSGRIPAATAARRARSLRVPVYTVSLGTPNGVVERKLTGGFTEQTRVPPDPATLRQVASISSGEFFTAPDDRRLTDVYERLGSRLGHRTERRELTDLFAAGAAGLLLAGGALSTLWFRRPL
jgi:Ca-activated chloride channel family protein